MSLFFFTIPLRLRYTDSRVKNAIASASTWKFFHFLSRCLRLRLHYGSSHIYLLALTSAFESRV